MTDNERQDHDRQDHEHYDQWDAAYLLGALSPAERREFEEHLAGCDRCTETLTDLAAMPALLGALPADDALAQLGEHPASAPVGQPSNELLPRLLDGLRRRRRRTRRWVLGGVGALVAAALLLAVVLQPALGPTQPSTTVALAPTATAPLDAHVELTSVPWGTRVTMSCSYEATGTTGYSHRYALYVIDREGEALPVSTWNAAPGQSVHTTGSMATPVGEVQRIELRDAATQDVLLSHAFG